MICRSHLSRLIQHHNHHHHAQKSCNTTVHLRRWISRTSIALNNTPDTYYDSQSGQHVPIHNEHEVSVYLRGVNSCSTQQVIESAKQYGLSGLILTSITQGIDGTVNDTSISSSNDDNIYLHIKPELYHNKHPPEMSFPEGNYNYNPCFEYKVGNEDDIISIIKHMTTKQQQKVNVSIVYSIVTL